MAAHLQQPKPLYRQLWAALTSRRLAVILFLVVLGFLLLSLVVPQVPRDIDPAGQEKWWAAAGERYGKKLDLARQFGLTSLFDSPSFLAVVSALLLNTLLCTVERLGRLWREVTRPPAKRRPEESAARADWQAEGVTPAQARRLLRRFGARLYERPGPPWLFHSVGWKLAPLGTVITHLALFLLILAALLHGRLARRERLWCETSAPGMYLDVEVVYDPGAGPFVVGALLLAVGSGLSLCFPPRQAWAHLAADGSLRVWLGMAGPAAEEEIERLQRRLGRPAGGPS